MPASETYNITIEIPGVGEVHLLVDVYRGHQGGRVLRQSIVEGRYENGKLLTADDRALAHSLLPDVD